MGRKCQDFRNVSNSLFQGTHLFASGFSLHRYVGFSSWLGVHGYEYIHGYIHESYGYEYNNFLVDNIGGIYIHEIFP
jgi:hypothetical protein